MNKITRKFCVVCKQNFGLSAFDGHASKKCRVCKTRTTKKKPKGQPMRSPNQMKRIASDCFNKRFDKVPAEFHELIYENEGLWAEMGGR